MMTLEQKFDSLIGRIEEATRNVDAGTLGSFDALNQEIMDVCNETRDSEPETAKALQKHMGRVILKLDELANSIAVYKDALQEKDQ